MTTSDAVLITPEEYKGLVRDQALLQALMDEGVDNWDGYAAACRVAFQGDNGEDEGEPGDINWNPKG